LYSFAVNLLFVIFGFLYETYETRGGVTENKAQCQKKNRSYLKAICERQIYPCCVHVAANKQENDHNNNYDYYRSPHIFYLIVSLTIGFTLLMGIANPTPVNTPVGAYIAVFIPTTSPLTLISGPPELPLLMAASV